MYLVSVQDSEPPIQDMPPRPQEADGSSAKQTIMEPRDPAVIEQFVQLFAANHRRLFAYIMVLVHDRNTAEEIFQEMSLVLWREFHHYRSDGDFVRWANAMSFNQVRKWRRNRKRDQLIFGETLFDDIAKSRDALEAEMDPRRSALAQCMKQLSDRDRQIIDLYYGSKTTADIVANQLGKSVHTIYKALKTIRKALLNCIDRRLTAQRGGG